MKSEKEEVLKEKLNSVTTPEKKELVMSNPELMWRAFKFFHKRLCRRCKVVVMSRVQTSGELQKDWLCSVCKVFYEKEIGRLK